MIGGSGRQSRCGRAHTDALTQLKYYSRKSREGIGLKLYAVYLFEEIAYDCRR